MREYRVWSEDGKGEVLGIDRRILAAVEVAHSWFNRFRKLLVRYEKLDRSFMALIHLAASIMALRKIKLDRTLFADKFLIKPLRAYFEAV